MMESFADELIKLSEDNWSPAVKAGLAGVALSVGVTPVATAMYANMFGVPVKEGLKKIFTTQAMKTQIPWLILTALGAALPYMPKRGDKKDA